MRLFLMVFLNCLFARLFVVVEKILADVGLSFFRLPVVVHDGVEVRHGLEQPSDFQNVYHLIMEAR